MTTDVCFTQCLQNQLPCRTTGNCTKITTAFLGQKLKHLFSKPRLPFSQWNVNLYDSQRELSSHITQMSRYQQPAFLYGSRHVYSSSRLGLTCILIKYYTRTISRCIYRQAACFNWYLCRGNGMLLAYAAVGPSGSERREV